MASPANTIAILLTLCLSLPPRLTNAQTIAKVAFSKFDAPPGWTKYNSETLSSGAAFSYGGPSLPFPYRSFVRKGGGFSYSMSLPPATYNVRFGFIEMSATVCDQSSSRRFSILAHGKQSPILDIFKEVGCRKPYVYNLTGLRVTNGQFLFKLQAANGGGAPPVLSNFVVEKVGTTSPPSPASEPSPEKRPIPESASVQGGKSSTVQISFQIGESPSGWTRFRMEGMTSDVGFSATDDTSVPEVYRRYVKRKDGFTYVHPMKDGAYDVTLGFAEILKSACKEGKRVFDIEVNGVMKKDVDIFSVDGCLSVATRRFDGIRVSSSKITIKLTPVAGTTFPPYLSTLVIEASSSTDSTDSKPSAPIPPVSAPLSQNVVYSVDAGGKRDKGFNVRGYTQTYQKVAVIERTSQYKRFSRYRYGSDFAYIIPVSPFTSYTANLFFAETYVPGCRRGFRVFDVFVHDAKRRRKFGASRRKLDVYASAGCRTAYSITLSNVPVGRSGQLAIRFESVTNFAMVSAIEVVSAGTGGPTVTPTVTLPPEVGTTTLAPETVATTLAPETVATTLVPETVATTSSPEVVPTTPSGPSKPRPSDGFRINVGNQDEGNVPGTKPVKSKKFVSGTVHASTTVLRSARLGEKFQYSFELAPGVYNIFLVFAEINDAFCNRPGKRVFNVHVNGKLQLEGYDIFQKTGCRKGVEEKIVQSVDAVDPQPLVIQFESVVGSAILGFLYVNPASVECVPASPTAKWNADHAAHSVPGSYPPQLSDSSPKSYVDGDGDDSYVVQIDGTSSHTHYVDVEKEIIGKLIDYTWTIVETGEVISKQLKFRRAFSLGTTRLKLAVMDNSCSTDEVETTVTVTAAMQPGVYCYYYTGLDEIPMGRTLSKYPRPVYASVSDTLSFVPFKSPFPFANENFALRCLFFLEVDKSLSGDRNIRISTFNTGDARVYKGGDMILDSSAMASTTSALPVGLTGFEVTYIRRKTSVPAKLRFVVDGSPPKKNQVFYDRKTVLPIVTSLSPEDGQRSGGTTVKVSGHGFYQPLRIFFDDEQGTVLQTGASSTQFSVVTPPSSKESQAEVIVKSSASMASNPMKFSYGSSTCDPVSFQEKLLKQPSGQEVNNLKLPTCATIWQDGKIYIGTVGGSVRVVGYNRETLKTTSHCYSPTITDSRFRKADNTLSPRSILGITFDPRDTVPRPYISTSTLNSGINNQISRDNKAAWRNGAVDRLKRGTQSGDSNVCLVYDKRIVSNVPVSNRDHSVNSLVFTQDGDLLISTGGMTNAGLPGYKMGSFWETELSGAILIAYLSRPSFDGNIQYNNDDEHFLSHKISGDVEVYSSGFRNAFGMTMTNFGDIYATDQGPNCWFGNVATACSNFDASIAAAWNISAEIDWAGTTDVPNGLCKKSISRADKVIHLTKNSFYGHPNIARGGDECAWIDPYNGRTAQKQPAPSSYKHRMVMLKSPVTGIGQYRGNHFCGKLKNDLIFTSYERAMSYRMGVSGNSITSGPHELIKSGGIMFVENAHGEIILPRYTEKRLAMFMPKVSQPSGLFIAGVSPFRHGINGGTLLTVGGFGFGSDASVSVGGSDCVVVRKSGTELQCKVPSHSVRGATVEVSVESGGSSATLKDAVLYMKV